MQNSADLSLPNSLVGANGVEFGTVSPDTRFVARIVHKPEGARTKGHCDFGSGHHNNRSDFGTGRINGCTHRMQLDNILHHLPVTINREIQRINKRTCSQIDRRQIELELAIFSKGQLARTRRIVKTGENFVIQIGICKANQVPSTHQAFRR